MKHQLQIYNTRSRRKEVFEPERFDDPWHKKLKRDLPSADFSGIPVRDYPMILTDLDAVSNMLA